MRNLEIALFLIRESRGDLGTYCAIRTLIALATLKMLKGTTHLYDSEWS